jgi:hypothetical protein
MGIAGAGRACSQVAFSFPARWIEGVVLGRARPILMWQVPEEIIRTFLHLHSNVINLCLLCGPIVVVVQLRILFDFHAFCSPMSSLQSHQRILDLDSIRQNVAEVR